MEVRKINAEQDSKAFRELRLEALQDSPTAFGSDYEREASFPPEKFNRGLKPDDEFREAFVLGAWSEEDELIGMAGFHVPNRLKTRHKAWIWGMFVVPEQRGQGVGRKLLQSLLDEAKQVEGLEQVHLTVITANEGARRLYENLGFVEYGCEPASIKVDGVNYDECFMVTRVEDLS